MANDMSEAERMTKFETQLENLVTVVTRMDAKMDAWQANFVSKELLDEKLKARDNENVRLNNEIQKLEKDKADKDDIERIEKEKASYKSNLPFWAAVGLSALAIIISIWPKK